MPVDAAAFRRVFEEHHEGRIVLEQLVQTFGRDPYVKGGRAAHSMLWHWYTYDSALFGNLDSAPRQAWWTDIYSQLVGKWVELTGIASDGTVSAKVNNAAITI